MKSTIVSLIVVMLLLTASVATAEDAAEAKPVDTTVIVAHDTVAAQASDPIVIYYLHMNRRCMTCEKLEAYSEEAVTSGFAEQLKDSLIVWRVVNFEEEGNEHYAKEYQLYSQSLIVSRLRDDKEIEWKNLDKIWELVHDKDEFLAYVQIEVRDFLKQTEEK
jgi:hypothetical protein